MSERKTAEIKFRVAPSAKARWQEAAAAEDISLSQLIDTAVEQYVAARNPKPTGLREFIRTNVADSGKLSVGVFEAAHRLVLDDTTKAMRPQAPEPCACKPWAFCPHKAPA